MGTLPTSADDVADVLIVGYGPVGQLLAVLLAQRGWRVVVVERWPHAYQMPRAVAFDSESARILAAAGIGEDIGKIGEPSGDYVWETASGTRLIDISAEEHGVCGWPESTSMYQPGLEAALIARGTTLPSLSVFTGHQAVGLVSKEETLELKARTEDGEERAFAARWVVGCDGANSFVRDHVGIQVTDLGFSHDWLICDVMLNEPAEFRPNNRQICDPARPRTAVSAGPGHRRWEFMRVPGESVAELDTQEAAWRLLALFGVSKENATLERYHVYTFQASFARQWRSGRMLLAGDAAHLMPPFAGQGMSSGFRDAANLSWKLDSVLRGAADEALLDTYQAERRAHVQHAIAMSVNLGRVICQTDPAAAADRDVVMHASLTRTGGKTRRQFAAQPLTSGFLHRRADGKLAPPAGALMPQARVARGAETGLFDDLAGLGFMLLASQDPRRLLDEDTLGLLASTGTRLLHVLPAGTSAHRADDGSVVDVDDVYLPYLAGKSALAALVRPDFYIFGTAGDRDELRALAADARGQLSGALLTR